MSSSSTAIALRGLYAITPDGLSPETLLSKLEAALQGGARIIQYRDKQQSSARVQMQTAQALNALCRRYDALFIINDDLELALAIDADGVHLGASDGNLAAARQALGANKILGASCYADFALAQSAATAGANYVAFGAAYVSLTKPKAPLAPHTLYARSQKELGLPCCAIGGITLENAPTLITAGADMLAIISGIFSAPDIDTVSTQAAAFQRCFADSAAPEGESH